MIQDLHEGKAAIWREVKVKFLLLPYSNHLLPIEYYFQHALSVFTTSVTVFSVVEGVLWYEMLRSSFFFTGPLLYGKPQPPWTCERGDLRGPFPVLSACFTPLHRKLLKKKSFPRTRLIKTKKCLVRWAVDLHMRSGWLVTCFCDRKKSRVCEGTATTHPEWVLGADEMGDASAFLKKCQQKKEMFYLPSLELYIKSMLTFPDN